MSTPPSNAPGNPPSAPGGPPPSQASIEQYKAKLADLGNLGTRLTATTTYYVSIVSALLGILAFKERPLSAIDPSIVILVGVGGILISTLWFTSVSFFRSFFRAKLRALQRIEEVFSHQTFQEEFDEMKRGGRSNWLWLERIVHELLAMDEERRFKPS